MIIWWSVLLRQHSNGVHFSLSADQHADLLVERTSVQLLICRAKVGAIQIEMAA